MIWRKIKGLYAKYEEETESISIVVLFLLFLPQASDLQNQPLLLLLSHPVTIHQICYLPVVPTIIRSSLASFISSIRSLSETTFALLCFAYHIQGSKASTLLVFRDLCLFRLGMEGNSGGGAAASGMIGGGMGNDVELLCKTLQVEHKLFYFDLKENPRGRYLKISEKTSATRSTIIVPFSGISWFLDLFNYYVNSDDQEVFSKELQLDTKVFYFDIGENRRGRFLKVSEASVSRNRSTIIVPAGSSRDEGWASFRNILAEINEASRLFILPNQPSSEPSERLGLSDDVGAGFISGHSSQPAPSSELSVERPVDLQGQDEIGNLGVSKVIRADQKRFFFDLGSNNRGHFLRISEVAGSDRSSIILPLSGLKQFHEIVGHFVEITKDRIEGMTGANVRTVDPPQR